MYEPEQANLHPRRPAKTKSSMTSNNTFHYPPAPKVLRLPSVRSRVGLGRTTIYQRIADGTFPRQIHIGPKAVGWIESEIDGWIAERVSQSRLQIAGGPQ